MSPQAQLQLNRTAAECGGAVTGDASWWGNGAYRPIEVVLRYRTEGRGDADAAVVSRWVVGNTDTGRGRFLLDVPSDGPVTYDGQLLRLLWQVSVTISGGGPFRRTKPLSVAAVIVVPRGWPLR